MLRNNKGMTLLDTIGAFTLIITIAISIIPMMIQVHMERENIKVQSSMLTALYNEVLLINNPENISPLSKQLKVKNVIATIHFTHKEDQLEGCISWTNYKNKRESKCLYVST